MGKCRQQLVCVSAVDSQFGNWVLSKQLLLDLKKRIDTP